MAQIKEALLELNPWWNESFRLDFKDRDIYREILKFMPLKQMIALTGLRRVGKTTILLKIVEDYVIAGFDPKNIVYFSFDEFKGIEIRQVIKEYEHIVERDLRRSKHLILLDEIQKLDGWDDQLKGVYDSLGKNVKIIISGSESLFINVKSKATLAGRLFEFKVEPLTFREFLSFKNFNFEPVGLHEKELSRLFSEFTFSLGFPELVGVREKNVIKKYVKEGILEKVIYRDMAGLFKIKDIATIESLLNILIEEPGQLLELSDLSKELKMSRQTLSNYLKYLEDSFLIRKLYNFSRNRRKVERKLKKYYPALISAELLFREDDFSKSKVFEWLLVTQLGAEFFWRDSYKHEVDVIRADEKPMPVEIKYGKVSFDGLLAFMDKFKVNDGFIVTHDKEAKQRINDKTISIIPAFKFLLTNELPNRPKGRGIYAKSANFN